MDRSPAERFPVPAAPFADQSRVSARACAYTRAISRARSSSTRAPATSTSSRGPARDSLRGRRRPQAFAWSGTAMVGDKQEWPDWYPPKEMIQRRPELRLNSPSCKVARRAWRSVIHLARAPCISGKTTGTRCIGFTAPTSPDDWHECLVRLHPHDQSGRD